MNLPLRPGESEDPTKIPTAHQVMMSCGIFISPADELVLNIAAMLPNMTYTGEFIVVGVSGMSGKIG